MPEQNSEAKRFGCPSCGGGLRWDIGAHTLICERCATAVDPKTLADPGEDAGDDMEVVSYQCPQCGAQIVSGTSEATSFCTYCGADVVLSQRFARMRRPDLIVPFRVDRNACEEQYRAFIRREYFVPGRLKKQETIRNFRPIYVPFWAYSVRIEGKQTVVIGQTVGDYYDTSRVELDASFTDENILYDASVAFEDETAARLAHTLEGAVPFREGYLSGMYAQIPDVGPEVYEKEAKASAALAFAEALRIKMKAAELRFDPTRTNQAIDEPTVERKLVLLPVWLLASRRQERVLYTAVSGTDGRVVCDPPVSYVRIGVLAALLAVLLFVLLMLAGTIPAVGLSAVASLLSILSLRTVVPVYTDSLFREMRAGEPDFGKPAAFMGQNQRRLMEKQKRIALRDSAMPGSGMADGCLSTILSFALRLLLVIGIAPLAFFVTNWHYPVLITAVILGVITCVRSFRWLRDLPRSRDRAQFTAMVSAGFILVLAMAVATILDPAEDLIHYGLSFAALVLNTGILLMLAIWRNRFSSRPIPFFEEVDTDA